MKIDLFKRDHINFFYFAISYKNVINYGKRFLYSIFVVNLDKINISYDKSF